MGNFQSIFRISDIISLGRSYLLLGVIAAVIFVVIYLLILKKMKKKKLDFSKGQLLSIMLFVCYMVIVVGATLLRRSGFYEGMIQGLFASYRDAWYGFDIISWRNIVLNIVMFIPVGFLLPLGWKSCRHFGKTYCIGFGLTLAIEFTQFMLGRGVFEVDDILNNTIGAMIGFGLAKLVLLICRQYTRRRISYFTLQLPLICTILFFAGIFITYENMEFGTMKPEQEMHYKDISVHTDLSFSSDAKDVPVYFIKKSSLEETRALADEIFEGLGTTVCPDRTDIYENTAIYWSEEDHYSIWITYMGLGYDITDFSDFDSEPKTGCGRDEIETALQERGIDVPAQAAFREEENGYYRFTLSQYKEGDTMLDGYLSCRYLKTGKLASIDNYLLCYDTCRTTPILSEQEAYKKLQEGAFYCHENCNGAEIIIESVTLDYQLDSKGFYRPVYVFSGTVDGEGAQMEVCAQK